MRLVRAYERDAVKQRSKAWGYNNAIYEQLKELSSRGRVELVSLDAARSATDRSRREAGYCYILLDARVPGASPSPLEGAVPWTTLACEWPAYALKMSRHHQERLNRWRKSSSRGGEIMSTGIGVRRRDLPNVLEVNRFSMGSWLHAGRTRRGWARGGEVCVQCGCWAVTCDGASATVTVPLDDVERERDRWDVERVSWDFMALDVAAVIARRSQAGSLEFVVGDQPGVSLCAGPEPDCSGSAAITISREELTFEPVGSGRIRFLGLVDRLEGASLRVGAPLILKGYALAARLGIKQRRVSKLAELSRLSPRAAVAVLAMSRCFCPGPSGGCYHRQADRGRGPLPLDVGVSTLRDVSGVTVIPTTDGFKCVVTNATLHVCNGDDGNPVSHLCDGGPSCWGHIRSGELCLDTLVNRGRRSRKHRLLRECPRADEASVVPVDTRTDTG